MTTKDIEIEKTSRADRCTKRTDRAAEEPEELLRKEEKARKKAVCDNRGLFQRVYGYHDNLR